jgi:pimeloyl-ACP methyl ester carboxylesterase
MRIGEASALPILFVPPLFEEMNRTRALIAGVMRGLAAQGFGCWLVDLPGTGESERALEECGWGDWRGGVMTSSKHVRERSGEPPLIASVRGGSLLEDAAEARCRWRFAPVPGASLARDLKRAALAGGGDWAGYPAPEELKQAVEAAQPAAVERLRTARLATDAGAADVKLAGPSLWRRSEPGTSPELAQAMAEDIAEWSRTCGAS